MEKKINQNISITLAFVIFCFILVSIIFFISSHKEQNAGHLQDFLIKNQISMFYSWAADENNSKLHCIVQRNGDGNNELEKGVKLSITDNKGLKLFEDKFDEVVNIYSSYILRKEFPQLVIIAEREETSIVNILEYRSNKVLSLTKSSEFQDDSIMNIDIRPQFQSSVKPASEPYQILINTGIGLASPDEKITKVFRYKNDNFVIAGEFSTTKIDDYIEKLLKEKSESR